MSDAQCLQEHLGLLDIHLRVVLQHLEVERRCDEAALRLPALAVGEEEAETEPRDQGGVARRC